MLDPWGGRGWDTIEGPIECRFSTIFGRFEVIFAQSVGDVWGRGEGFINPAGGRGLWVSGIHGRNIYKERGK